MSTYGAFVYGTSSYQSWLDSGLPFGVVPVLTTGPVRPTSMRRIPSLFFASKNNRIGEELTHMVVGGSVSLDANNDVPMQVTIETADHIATSELDIVLSAEAVNDQLDRLSRQLKAFQGDDTPASIVAIALAIDAAVDAGARVTPAQMYAWADQLKSFRGNNTPAPIVAVALALDDLGDDIRRPLSDTPRHIPAFSWVAPFMQVVWWDADRNETLYIKEQVGLYITMPPSETHTAGGGRGTITGYDPTWILQQSILPDGFTAQAGANVVRTMRDLVRGAGFTRVNIPSKSNTFRKKRSYDPGTSRLEVLNDLAMRIGYYPMWADRQGVITSGHIRTLIKEEPARRISSTDGDVVDVVQIEQDAERLCNRVVIFKADTNEDDDEDTRIHVVMENRRAKSPVSIDNLGIVLGKKVEASNIDTEDDARALARKTLEEGASVLTRLSVSTLPDPRFGVRDVVNPVINRDDGTAIARGYWWCDQVTIGFTPQDGPMTWRLSKLEEWEPENDD